jgi:hypothetical protein
MAGNQRNAGGPGSYMQASNSSSPNKHTAPNEDTSMIVRNPAPDASPARAPSESKTITVQS